MFVPLKIAERQVEHAKRLAQQMTDFDEFVVTFKRNVANLQGKRSEDVAEQAFLDLMQRLSVVRRLFGLATIFGLDASKTLAL